MRRTPPQKNTVKKKREKRCSPSPSVNSFTILPFFPGKETVASSLLAIPTTTTKKAKYFGRQKTLFSDVFFLGFERETFGVWFLGFCFWWLIDRSKVLEKDMYDVHSLCPNTGGAVIYIEKTPTHFRVCLFLCVFVITIFPRPALSLFGGEGRGWVLIGHFSSVLEGTIPQPPTVIACM